MAKVFSESELRSIAEALGDTLEGLTHSEIDELFQICRVPDETGKITKWRRIFHNLWNHQVRVKNRTNALEFIRQAMRPSRYLKSPERFETMRMNLNRALSFAGLQVDDAGQLSNCERVTTLPEAERRARELRGDLESRGVHSEVLRFCRAELLSDNYFHGVQEATKSIFERLREMTGCVGDGAPLVDDIFGGAHPRLAINALNTVGERAEHSGFGNLLKGAYGMFRTPTAHDPKIKWEIKKEDAEDLMSLASFIHRRLDGAHPV